MLFLKCTSKAPLILALQCAKKGLGRLYELFEAIEAVLYPLKGHIQVLCAKAADNFIKSLQKSLEYFGNNKNKFLWGLYLGL